MVCLMQHAPHEPGYGKCFGRQGMEDACAAASPWAVISPLQACHDPGQGGVCGHSWGINNCCQE